MFFTFIASLAASLVAFEVLTFLQGPKRRVNILDGAIVEGSELALRKPRSALDAILVAVFPERFDPGKAKNYTDVVTLLKRAGYPYDTPGDFYVSAIRDFGLFLIVGAGVATAMAIADMTLAGVGLAFIFLFLGLRRPYTRLKTIAKKRAEGMKTNMLIGLTVLKTLITSGVSPVEAAKNLQKIGGPSAI